MFSLIAIRLGHKLWIRHKYKKLFKQKQIILNENKKSKRLSIYKQMLRENKVMRKKQLPVKQRKYIK